MADFSDRSGWGAEARLYFTPGGSLESFPLPGGRRRWVVLAGGDAQDVEAETGHLIRSVRDLTGIALAASDRLEGGGFRPERGLVRRSVVQRVILCGDAAHVMSPIGGQGMNTGLADAWHLAATLRALLRGTVGAPGSALRRFERCRRRAYRIAAQRAAHGMWLGTRSGFVLSTLRSTLARRVFFRPPVRNRLAPRFAMWTIPDGRDPLLPNLTAVPKRKPWPRRTP